MSLHLAQELQLVDYAKAPEKIPKIIYPLINNRQKKAIAESFKIMGNNIADRDIREELREIKTVLDSWRAQIRLIFILNLKIKYK